LRINSTPAGSFTKINDMKRLGLVLSGGGARGIAHLGVLAALEEANIRPGALSGTSAGAIIAALYAAGHSPLEIKRLIQDTAFFGISHLLLGKPGVFNMDGFRNLLKEHLPVTKFEDLPIPLFVTATNLSTANAQCFSSGPLIEPLLASACMPVVFEPVTIGRHQYVDGGVVNNFPVEPLNPICDVVIGSHVNRLAEFLPADHPWHKAYILDRCFHLAIAKNVYEKAAGCDLFLDHPGMSAFGIFDTHRADELFDIGYKQTLLHRNKWLALAHDACQQAG
jgi:NTE family protein